MATFRNDQTPIRQDESFGRWVRQRRTALDLSRESLAGLVGCAAETIRKIERDQRRPSSQMAELLAVHLQIPLENRAEFLRFARGKRLDDPGQGSGASTALPLSITPLVGRESDLETLGRLFGQAQVRLVTLAGPPGVGKTRLAVALASAVQERFPAGIGYVDLAATNRAADVLAVIAQSLGIKDVPNQSSEQTLKTWLRGRRMLLVLDNFEQVVNAAPKLLELLQNAAQLKILVTSRISLNLSAEYLYTLRPLDLPIAAELFCLRAQAVQPDFQLTPGNTTAVEMICQRLDGLPLAIELAASRLRIFTPAALLSDLSIGLSALHGKSELPGRQQTLREAIAWSYELLDEDFKAVFRKLAVFAGGWTLEAAAAVCDLQLEEMVDALIALLDASLIQQTVRGTEVQRFGMLALIREYALEQRIEAGEDVSTSQRHGAYFVHMAQSAAPEWLSNARTRWMELFRAEHDNLRAALAWAQHNRPVELVKLAGALLWFWRNAGFWHEGRAWLRQANRAADELQLAAVHPAECARVVQAEGVLAWEQCDIPEAQRLLAQAAESYQRLEMGAEWAYSLAWLGVVAGGSGANEQAQNYFQQSLALFDEAQDQRGLAFALTWYSAVQMRSGKTVEAQESIQRAEAIWQLLEDDWGRASASLMLASLALLDGDFSGAEIQLKQGLPFAERAGDAESLHSLQGSLAYVQMCTGHPGPGWQSLQPALSFFTGQGTDKTAMSMVLILAGTLAREQGKMEDARKSFMDCLRLHDDLQNPLCIFWGLKGLAGATLADQPEQAVRLWSAAETYRPEPLVNVLGLGLSHFERSLYERDERQINLLSRVHVEAWQAGQQKPLAELLAEQTELK